MPAFGARFRQARRLNTEPRAHRPSPATHRAVSGAQPSRLHTPGGRPGPGAQARLKQVFGHGFQHCAVRAAPGARCARISEALDVEERPSRATAQKQRSSKITLTAPGLSLLLTICRVRRLTSAARALSLRPVRALSVASQGSRLIGISTTHADFRSITRQTEAKCEVKDRHTSGADCTVGDTGNCR